MPRYEFRCTNGHTFDRALQIDERDGAMWCQLCQDDGLLYVPVERQPSAPNFSIGGFNAKNGYSKAS